MIKFKKGKFASLRRKVAVSAINALNVEISQIPDLPKNPILGISKKKSTFSARLLKTFERLLRDF